MDASVNPASKITVVTGANSGIGRATALHLAEQGHLVYGTVRDKAKATKLLAMAEERGVEVLLVELDITDDESVRRGMAEVLDATGRVDVLVNNAGVGGTGVVEDTDPATYLELMNINLCGAVRCIHAVLPSMRRRRQGAIVNVTSIAGRIAALAQSPYVASKWAFEGVSEGLAQELAPFGIRVVIIEPGVTKSAIFAKSPDAPSRTGAYPDHYRRLLQFYTAGLMAATDPFEVARFIHHAITTDDPELRYQVSWGAREIVEGRERMSDRDWVSLGMASDDEEYYDRFRDLFGLDISTD
jgi:NAD(P)-dependent dehydrogenase (short-subunit alcohol dehydrogenase family)